MGPVGRVASECFHTHFRCWEGVLAPAFDGGKGRGHSGARNLVIRTPSPYASTMKRTNGPTEQPRRRGRVYRRIERVILSLAMRVVAAVVERKLLKAIERTEPAEQQRAGLRWA
jgi:hypothetical protein